MKLNCKICNSEFVRFGKQALVAVCCSTKCLGEYNKAKANTKCDKCGIDFHKKESQKEKSTNHFCSRDCLAKFKKENFTGEKNHQFGLKGSLNSSFKGDLLAKKNHNSTDYYIFVGSDYPRSDKSGRITLHRYLVEKNSDFFEDSFFEEINGIKIIKKGFDIHHKDHDHDNNNINNLEILTRSQHTSYHNQFKEIIRCDKGKIKTIKTNGNK